MENGPGLKIYILLKMVIFHCYVSLLEDTYLVGKISRSNGFTSGTRTAKWVLERATGKPWIISQPFGSNIYNSVDSLVPFIEMFRKETRPIILRYVLLKFNIDFPNPSYISSHSFPLKDHHFDLLNVYCICSITQNFNKCKDKEGVDLQFQRVQNTFLKYHSERCWDAIVGQLSHEQKPYLPLYWLFKRDPFCWC